MHKTRLAAGAALTLLTYGGAARAAAPPQRAQCPRPTPGDFVQAPADIYSSKGVLDLALDYRTEIDSEGRRLFCFVTPDGLQSPTLHVRPGDTLNIALTNKEPKNPQTAKTSGKARMQMPMAMPMAIDEKNRCGASMLSLAPVNIHFHGMNVAPTCHEDEVIHTIVNPGQTFTYTVHVPKDEPPGLYWYHPHIHGVSSAAVLGGGSAAIVVEGIENLQPKVANLPTRVIVMRDQPIIAANPPPTAPYWDISINYVPIIYPTYEPAKMVVARGHKEFWRVVNASANTIDRLVLKFDGVKQQVEIVAEDGVVLGSQDGAHRGKLLLASEVYIPPASRAEFIIPAIPATVKHVTLEALKPDTGPGGDVETTRLVARIEPGDDNQAQLATLKLMPNVSSQPGPQRFDGLDRIRPDKVRHLFMTEIFPDPKDPDEGLFYITVRGKVPELFDPNAPPAITTTQGAVEDWVIENQTQEVHEFHIHQIHFQVREINGSPLPVSQRQIRDTYEVPYWTGTGPYPSITVRMDFRGPVVGDFVYHCHILDHEDAGMMAIIRVKPKNG